MEQRTGTLHFICGRLASGKTTVARQIAEREPAVLVCEDVWLSNLTEGIQSFDDYLKWSRRWRAVMGPLIVEMLRMGISVVLDFGGNTSGERNWVRSLFASAGAGHVLHYLDVPEEVCLSRLAARNELKPEGLYFAATSETEFRAIAKYFQPPTSDSFAAVSLPALIFAQGDDKTAKQDVKEAGDSTKKAVKKTGKNVKKGTKKVVHKSAEKTAEGADEVEDKTKP